MNELSKQPGELSASRRSSDKDARAARTSVALQETLLALLEEKPFEQITVREICARSGIHYATFFRHHPNKEALLDHVAAEQIDRLCELTLPIMQALDDQTSFRALCDYVNEHRILWSALLNGGAGAAMREEWLRVSREVAATTPPRNSWLPVELGIICSVSLIAETVSWWLAQKPGAYSVDAIADIMHRLLLSSTMRPD
jgi:AcrR family transcriptional regulator